MEKPAKFLVVDDSQDTHDMMDLIFNVPGEPGQKPVILHGWTGLEALEILAANQDVDVVVLDLVMPRLDGFEVLTRLAADPRFRTIPVLVFSAGRDEAVKALRLGARDFVNKPGDYLEMKLRILNLVESKRRADASDRSKIDFLSVVSHELKTPMNGVIGMAQALRDLDPSPEQSECLSALEDSSRKMMSLINNLLWFLESENPLHRLPRVPFNLEEVLEASWAPLRPEAARTGVRVETSVDPGIPQALLGLPDKIQLVLFHLVGNAIRFSPGGKVKVSALLLDSGAGTVDLSFSVADTGCGFPPEWKDRLMEPFTQADATETRRLGGLGIGLSIASRLIQMQGGVLDVHSRPGLGSTFRFTLKFDPVS